MKKSNYTYRNLRSDRRLHPKVGQHGVTLLEMSLTIVIIGVLAGVILLVLRPMSSSSSEGAADNAVSDARDAIIGYALAHQALPPSVPGGGWLNPTTVGLPAGSALWYSVDSRLTGLGSVYNPDPNQHVPQFRGANGQLLSWQNYTPSHYINFCHELRIAWQSPAVTLGGVPVAFSIQLSKTRDVPTSSIPLPGTAQAQKLAAQGIRSQAVGLGELFVRLHCAARLANVGGAAKSVVAAQDLTQLAQVLTQFRQLEYQRAEETVLSHDLQILIRATLLANLAADFISTTMQIVAIFPGVVDDTNPPGVIALVSAIMGDVVIVGFAADMLEIASTINVNADQSGVQSALAAVGGAQNYVRQLNQLLQERETQYQAMVQGI